MALIKAGTYRFNGLLDSCGYSVYFEESIQFYNTIPFLVDEEYSALIKAETGFDLAAGTYYLKRRCGGFRLSFTAGERYKNWVDYTQVYPVSATPFVPDELLALLPQGIDDIMYDSYAYPYDYYTDVNVWDEEGGNIVTIPEDTEVSDEFGAWFTANTKRLSTITYNGSTIASLLGGQTATLKCAGMTMESDVVVDVAETTETFEPSGTINITENGEYAVYDYKTAIVNVESGGGLAINGIVEQYKVNAGATVNAGDFVEFVNKCGAGEFHAGITKYLTACKLDNSRVLVAYSDGGNSNYGTAAVLTVDGGEVTVGAEKVFQTSAVTYISVVTLTDSKVLVAYACSGVRAIVLAVTGTVITMEDTYLALTSVSCNSLSSVALTDSRVLVAYRSVISSYDYGRMVCLDVNGSVVTQTATKDFETKTSGVGEISMTKLAESSALVAYKVGANGYGCAKVVAIDDSNTISVGAQYKFNATDTIYISVGSLTDSKALVTYQNRGNTGYGTAVVLTISGMAITIGTPTVFSNNTTSYICATPLSESKVLVAYYGTAVVLTIDGTTISCGEPAIFNAGSTEGTSNGSYKGGVAFSESSALVVVAGGSIGKYASLFIDGDTITVADASGTFVKPATSRLHNVGVAATGGTEGETVDVYVVG